MKEDQQLILRSDDPGDAVIRFPQEGIEMSLPVTPLGEGVVRIEAMPFMVEEVSFRDVVRVEKRADGSLEFVCVLEPANWRTYAMILSREAADGQDAQQFCLRLQELGCYWERDFGGLLLIAVPPELEIDPGDVLAQVRGCMQ